MLVMKDGVGFLIMAPRKIVSYLQYVRKKVLLGFLYNSTGCSGNFLSSTNTARALYGVGLDDEQAMGL